MSELQRCLCACGGEIVAREGQQRAAVIVHNQTPRHVAWRDRGGLNSPDGPAEEERRTAAWLVMRETLRGQAA